MRLSIWLIWGIVYMGKRKPDFICPDWLRHELENWARWCWRGAYPHPLPPQQCASLEGNYQRVNDEGATESVDRKPIPVNEVNAALVQGVYETLPWLQQQVLRAEYPQRHGSKRTFHVGRDEHGAALNVALFRVMVAFERGGY